MSHYIEFTAVIGPIDPPLVLHLFDGGGKPVDTVHGQLAAQIFDVLHDTYLDIDASAKIVTDEELQTRADALAMRVERDRLRAVLDHLRESAESAIGQDREDQYDEGNRDAWLYVRNAVDGRAGPATALDVNKEFTDAEAERSRLRDELEAVRPQYEQHIRVLNAALKHVETDWGRLREAVIDLLNAVAQGDSPMVTQAALDHLGVIVGWQLDPSGRPHAMGGTSDG